jgi:hypothetical protein
MTEDDEAYKFGSEAAAFLSNSKTEFPSLRVTKNWKSQIIQATHDVFQKFSQKIMFNCMILLTFSYLKT